MRGGWKKKIYGNDAITVYGKKRNLIKLRIENNYSKAQVAKLMGMSVMQYDKREKGLTMLTEKDLVKLANIFNVSIDEILGDDVIL